MIISEVDMPNMSGLALCAQLKASQHAKIPFVFLTADNRIDSKVKGLEAGADDYLIRPIYTRELAARVFVLERQAREQMNDSQSNQQYFGDLEKMSVIDLVQAMNDGQKTGTIKLKVVCTGTICRRVCARQAVQIQAAQMHSIDS